MSPEPGACRPASAFHHTFFNTEAAASSHSAPEPSSRVASPTHAYCGRLRPASASATVPSHSHESEFEQSLGLSAYHGSPQVHTGTGPGHISISERQDSGHAGGVSQVHGDDLADSIAASPGQASIIEAVAAAQQQADASANKQGKQ